MSKPDLHVLVLPSWYPSRVAPLSGIFFKNQARAVKRAGAKVGVVYPEFRSLRTLSPAGLRQSHSQVGLTEEDGIPTYRKHCWNIPPRGRLRAWLWVRLAMRLTQLYVRDFGPPDVLHAQSALWGGVSAMKLASRFGVPYVVTEHSTAYARGMIKRWQEPLVRETFRRAGAVLAVSRGLSNLLAKYVSGAKVQVVPNMVDTDFFVLPPRPRDAEAFTFLTVALLQPKKGIDVLVQAFARAFGHRPDVCLEIGGDGPQRDELESLAANLGVSGAVRFLGVLSPADVREAMWRANVFVLSSYVETFGVVLIEAMATGLPVIATRCGGPEHLIRDSLGCLVDPGSADQLARALASVYERYPKLRGRDKETRQHIVSNYSNNAVANTLLEVFRAVAGRS